MTDPFIRLEHEGEQILVARSVVAHARYQKATDTKPARVVLLLVTKGIVPDPRQPKNVTFANTRFEFAGQTAETVWAQLWQPVDATQAGESSL